MREAETVGKGSHDHTRSHMTRSHDHKRGHMTMQETLTSLIPIFKSCWSLSSKSLKSPDLGAGRENQNECLYHTCTVMNMYV